MSLTVSLTALTLLQKRIVFFLGLAVIFGFIMVVNNPFAGAPTATIIGTSGEEVVISLGIIGNVNLGKTTTGKGTDGGEGAPNFGVWEGGGWGGGLGVVRCGP